MNNLNLLIPGSLLGFLLFTSCDYIEVPPPDLADTVVISTTASIVRADIVINEQSQAEFTPSFLECEGDMNGTDIDGNHFRFNCSINMSHQALYDDYRTILIQEGKFSLQNEEGDILNGDYTGGGRDEGNGIVIGLAFSITGGTGKFKLAKGTLTAEWLMASPNKPVDMINYKGIILVPEYN